MNRGELEIYTTMSVEAFTDAMLDILFESQNLKKVQWPDCSKAELYDRMSKNLKIVEAWANSGHASTDEVKRSMVDVANYMMMLHELASK